MQKNSAGIVIKSWVRQTGDAPVTAPAAAAGPELEALRQEIIQDAQEQARQIIDRARQEAEETLDLAEKQAAGMRTQAYEQGLSQAQEEIEKSIQAQREQSAQAFDVLLSGLKREKAEAEAFLQSNILELSLSIAEKVVDTVLSRDDAVFQEMVKSAVTQLVARENFVIRVSLREYVRYFAPGDGWLTHSMPTAPFTVVVDENLPDGGCVLESPSARIDLGVSTQFARISKALGEVSD